MMTGNRALLWASPADLRLLARLLYCPTELPALVPHLVRDDFAVRLEWDFVCWLIERHRSGADCEIMVVLAELRAQDSPFVELAYAAAIVPASAWLFYRGVQEISPRLIEDLLADMRAVAIDRRGAA